MLRFSFVPGTEITLSQMRVALVNAVIARQRAEKYIVRIEDIAAGEAAKAQEQDTLALLKKFAIEEDQRFYQSDALGRYQQFALSLLEQKKAFACICTQETDRPACCTGSCRHDREKVAREIQSAKLPFVICIQAPRRAISFSDTLHGKIHAEAAEIADFVILHADGSPSSDFATACDDMLSDVTLVIRSEASLKHTPRQIHLKQLLGYTAPTAYAHLPDILHHPELPTEKRVTVKSLLQEGFLPDAIINYLLSVGLNPPEARFTLPDAIAWFDLAQLSGSAETFDIERLRALNRAHLAAMDDKALSRLFGFADADIGKLAKCYLQEAATLNALDQRIKAIFSPKACHGEQAERMQHIAALIAASPFCDTFEAFKQYLLSQSGLQEEALLPLLQHLMTGDAVQKPAAEEIYPLIKPYITEIARCTS